MDIYEGVCMYCGTVEPVMADSQEEANYIVSKKCTCPGALLEERQEQLTQNLQLTIGPECEEAGLEAFDADIVDTIAILAKFVLQDRLQQISVACGKTTLKIAINTKGQVKITRTEKKAVAAEC